jgi:hypothetical protein
MSVGPHHAKLGRLEAEKDEAYDSWAEAKRALEQDAHLAARQAVADLAGLRDSILHRKPDAPTPDEQPNRERAETVALCRQIIQNEDLVLQTLGTSDDLRVIDLSIDREFKRADWALTDARGAVARFERENAAGLKKEADAAELDRIRDAFAANDLDAVKAGLAG